MVAVISPHAANANARQGLVRASHMHRTIIYGDTTRGRTLIQAFNFAFVIAKIVQRQRGGLLLIKS